MIPARIPTPDSASALALRNASTAADALNVILADLLAIYFKTKNFHWHMTGPHFRDYHLMLDEQATELFSVVDDIAERIRKTGNTTLRSIGDIARRQTIRDNDSEFVSPSDMLAELREDNFSLVRALREAKVLVDEARDNATSGLLDGWTDQAERRAWFLFEATQFARAGTVRWSSEHERTKPAPLASAGRDGDLHSSAAVRRLAGFPVWFYGPGRRRRRARTQPLS